MSSTDSPSFPSQLKEKANLTLAVGTLPLPPHFSFIPPGRMCRVAGWGITEVEKLGSKTLQEVKLRLMDPQACRHFNIFDHNLQLCVGNPKKTKSVFKVILRLGFFSTITVQGSDIYGRRWGQKIASQCQGLRSQD